MGLLEYAVLCGFSLATGALGAVCAILYVRTQAWRLRQDVAARLQRFETRLLDAERRREPRPEIRAATAQPPGGNDGRMPLEGSWQERRSWPSASPVPPLPAEPSREHFTERAAAALEDQQSFREFAASSRGSGFLLRAGAEVEPATGPNADTASDLWIVPDGGSRLVYPGYNLRRSQSALVADAGRLARERLEWLYEVMPGPQLGATRPARVAADDWTVMERGILTVPFRAG